MGDFPVVPRESRMRMGPYPPGVIAIWDSWRANLNNLHGPLVKISEPVTYQGELQCDRGPGAVRVFHVAGLHCRHLDLHSAVLWEQLLPGQDPNAAVDPLVFHSGAVQCWTLGSQGLGAGLLPLRAFLFPRRGNGLVSNLLRGSRRLRAAQLVKEIGF